MSTKITKLQYFLLLVQQDNTRHKHFQYLKNKSDESTHFPSYYCPYCVDIFSLLFFSFVVVGRKPIFFFLYLRHADDIVSCKYEKAEICIRIFYYFSLPTERHHKLIRGIVFLCVITLMCCSCCFGQFIDNLIGNTQWMRKNPHIHDYSENLTQRRVRTVKRLMVFK